MATPELLSLDELRGWTRGQKHPELFAARMNGHSKHWCLCTPGDMSVLCAARGEPRTFVSLDSLERFVQSHVANPLAKAVEVRIAVLPSDLLG